MAFYDSTFFDNGNINLLKGAVLGTEIMIRFAGGKPLVISSASRAPSEALPPSL